MAPGEVQCPLFARMPSSDGLCMCRRGQEEAKQATERAAARAARQDAQAVALKYEIERLKVRPGTVSCAFRVRTLVPI